MAIRKVSWTKTAVKQFNNAINYIPEDFAKQAEKVKQIILNKVNKLSNDNIVNRQDQYKKIMMEITCFSKFCIAVLHILQLQKKYLLSGCHIQAERQKLTKLKI